MFIEDLEDELIAKQERINKLTNELITMFDEVNFNRKVTPNGISFDYTYHNVYANFYVDGKLDYKGYVTNDSDNSSNYSIKGNIDNVISAADNLIDMFFNEVDNSSDENMFSL